ncbi:hypothetical protein PHK61_30910 [Actinomycetospora lutea]|uniref:hypothetical protein n=1 Tax=Actinomycetospora lutea TaxID=663604 RepID=UPI0023658088|nr:hypothetical protein [Actinomycetospora lutea]MDD7942832.1 hypothetical protein [Actinomycetospora lutea]
MEDSAGKRSRSLKVVELSLTAFATLGVGVYVLLNGLYVEFYDDFGLRPEDVGWTQTAIIGRAAWIALVVVFAVGSLGALGVLAEALSHRSGITDALRRSPRYAAGGCALMLAAALLLSFVILHREVENDAAEVKVGHTVDGVGFITPLVDVQVNRAEVRWIGDPTRAPFELVNSRFLSYMGSNGQASVFLSCGRRTITVPTSQVSVHILLENRDLDENRQEYDFESSC